MKDYWMDTLVLQCRQDKECIFWTKQMNRAEEELIQSLSDQQRDLFYGYQIARICVRALELERAYRIGIEEEKQKSSSSM